MRRNTLLPEEPLFQPNNSANADANLSLEEIDKLGKKEEINRKNKILRFSFSSFYIMIGAIFVIIIIDVFEQKYKIDNKLLLETFELVKYATTTILGFLFANNLK